MPSSDTAALTRPIQPAKVRFTSNDWLDEGPMALTIYHNPRCSKSRQTLEIIRAAGVEPIIILYLQEAPGATDILGLADKLGVPVSDLLRRGESEFKAARDLPTLDNDTALAAWIEAHPATLQRPIVVDSVSGKAVVGRPPENVTELLP